LTIDYFSRPLIYGGDFYVSKVYLIPFGSQALAAGFLGNSLKLRRGFGVIGLEFHWSASGKVLKRAEMPFVKVNGKFEFSRQI